MPRSGRSPRGVNGNPLQYSCPEIPIDRAWRATVHGVMSWTRLSTHTQLRNKTPLKLEGGKKNSNCLSMLGELHLPAGAGSNLTLSSRDAFSTAAQPEPGSEPHHTTRISANPPSAAAHLGRSRPQTMAAELGPKP